MNSSTPFRTAALAALAVVSSDTFVSVCRDATYKFPSARGAICAGAGEAPSGTACPKIGDLASGDCYGYLPSFDGAKCTAKENAVCTIVDGNTWGCVFPSVGCRDSVSTSYPSPTYPSMSLPDVNATTAGTSAGYQADIPDSEYPDVEFNETTPAAYDNEASRLQPQLPEPSAVLNETASMPEEQVTAPAVNGEAGGTPMQPMPSVQQGSPSTSEEMMLEPTYNSSLLTTTEAGTPTYLAPQEEQNTAEGGAAGPQTSVTNSGANVEAPENLLSSPVMPSVENSSVPAPPTY